MTTRLPSVSDQELSLMTNGTLAIRYLEIVRRLERMPNARWLYKAHRQHHDEWTKRKHLGLLSPALCGIVSHCLDAAGVSTPCTCSDD